MQENCTPKVLNWDSCGNPKGNIINIERNRKRFKSLIKEKPEIIRIALHPRDPCVALDDQKKMIAQIKNCGYRFLTYSELVPELLMRSIV